MTAAQDEPEEEKEEEEAERVEASTTPWSALTRAVQLKEATTLNGESCGQTCRMRNSALYAPFQAACKLFN